ncbi:MAG: amino acid-binding ACT domain protein [Candidatus Freyarchaeota archaeon]
MYMVVGMWSRIASYFKEHPKRLAVAKVLVENGLSIRNGKIYCNEIEIPPVRVARVAGVDRRTVMETIKMIERDEELRTIFALIKNAGMSLKDVARPLNLGVVEITPDDPRTVGIVAGVTSIIAREGISIRQALTDDPELSPDPKLTVIADRKIPGELIPKLLKVKGVAKVSIY